MMERSLQVLTEFQISLAHEAVARGADCIWLSDDHAGVDAPFLSPDMLWDLDFRFQKRIVDEVHRLGKPCVMHSCGNLNKTIEGMIATGVDGIMGFQPTANNDISSYKKKYGDRIVLIGNICVTRLMPRGTPWEIDQEVKKLVEKIGYGGGFVLSTCNSLLKDEPIANVLAMHLGAEKYGHHRTRHAR
jgi:uroporphyrinogen decarboxylase